MCSLRSMASHMMETVATRLVCQLALPDAGSCCRAQRLSLQQGEGLRTEGVWLQSWVAHGAFEGDA